MSVVQDQYNYIMQLELKVQNLSKKLKNRPIGFHNLEINILLVRINSMKNKLARR